MSAGRVKHQRGATLTELLVAMAVSLITIGAVYGVHLLQVRQQVVQEDVSAMQQTARAALDMMVREIRMAGYDPLGRNRDADPSNNFHGIICHPTELQIRADLNGNGTLINVGAILNSDGSIAVRESRNPHETIVYLHDDSTFTLRRKVGQGGRQIVAEHIESLDFTCLDVLGRPTAHAPDVRAVAVQVTARAEHADNRYPEHDGYRTLTLRSRVVPRNLQ